MKPSFNIATQSDDSNFFNTIDAISIQQLNPIIDDILRCMHRLNLFSSEVDCANVEINFLFCCNNVIQKLNKMYRKKDYPTDVLSFPLHSDGIIGDIAISVEKAIEQSQQLELSVVEEIQFLVIHGILHLLGYDHEKSPEDEKIMQQLEQKIRQEVSK